MKTTATATTGPKKKAADLGKLLEIFKDNVGIRSVTLENPNYILFEDGRIYSLSLNDFKIHSKTNEGYHYVCIRTGEGSVRTLVHRLVATHFVKCEDPSYEVHHIDHDKSNNSAYNLMWCSHSYNCKERYRHERSVAAEDEYRTAHSHYETADRLYDEHAAAAAMGGL